MERFEGSRSRCPLRNVCNRDFSTPTNSAVLGIGGTHYNQKFTKMALNGEAVFGHMIPKYAVPMIDAEMLAQCVQRTFERSRRRFLTGKESVAKTNLSCSLPCKRLICPTRKSKENFTLLTPTKELPQTTTNADTTYFSEA